MPLCIWRANPCRSEAWGLRRALTTTSGGPWYRGHRLIALDFWERLVEVVQQIVVHPTAADNRGRHRLGTHPSAQVPGELRPEGGWAIWLGAGRPATLGRPRRLIDNRRRAEREAFERATIANVYGTVWVPRGGPRCLSARSLVALAVSWEIPKPSENAQSGQGL